MNANRRMWVVAGLAASLSLWGCMGKPPVNAHAPGLTKQDDLVTGAAQASAGSLKLTVQDRRPVSAGYKVNYIPIQEWNKARFTLDKVLPSGATDTTFTAVSSGPGPGAGVTWLNNDPAATVSSLTMTRTTNYSFGSVTPGSGYRLKVELIRMEGTTERVIASGTNAGSDGSGFIIATGTNTVNVLISLTPVNTASPTSGGRPVVTIPQPAAAGGGGTPVVVAPNSLDTAVSTSSSFSASQFAGANGTTFNAPNTLALTQLHTPGGIDMAPDGTIYVASTGFNRIMALNTTSGSSAVVGTGTAGDNFNATTNTNATTNQLNAPTGLTIDPINDTVYFCDTGNHRVFKLQGTALTKMAGYGATATITNGTSLATEVALGSPQDIEIDGDGSLYFTDHTNSRVCRLTPSDGKIYQVANVTNPRAIVLDRINKVMYVGSGNTIKVVPAYDTITTPGAIVTAPATLITFTSAGTPTPLSGGMTWASRFPNYVYEVTGLAYDYAGTLYTSVRNATTATAYNPLVRVPVSTAGALQTGRTTEVIAGWTTSSSAYFTGTTTDITQTPFVESGYGGLMIDLRNAGSLFDPVNTLYWFTGRGNSGYYGNVVKLTQNVL